MYNKSEFLKKVIRGRKPELTEEQVNEVCKRVRFWLDREIDESIDDAVILLSRQERIHNDN